MEEEVEGEADRQPAEDETVSFSQPWPVHPSPLRIYDQEESSVSSLWLITFTDIMALMLTFFVLLYAMSAPDEEKWVDVSSTMTRGFSKYSGARFSQGSQDSITLDKVDFSEALNLGYLQSLIAELKEKDKELSSISLKQKGDGLVISLPDELLFAPGEAEINLEGKKTLFALAGVLSHIRNRIEVAGHADPLPLNELGKGFTSTWELSLARAANVAGILENVGYRRPVTLRGVSSAAYENIPETIDEEDRLALSRRVDIVIMRDDGRKRLFMEFGMPE